MAPQLTVKTGSGSWVTAHDNTTGSERRLLDMTCGIGATSTGHCHPKIVEAVKEQVGTMVHAQQNIFGEFASSIYLYRNAGRDRPRCLGSLETPHVILFFFREPHLSAGARRRNGDHHASELGLFLLVQ